MSSKSRAAITTEINTNFPNNTSGGITAALLRSTTQDITDSAFYMLNDAFIMVTTTSNATTNGTALKAAYTAAAALTPNGAALSATNRAAIILPPGAYNLGSSAGLTLAEFVDVIGLTGKYQDVVITSAMNAASGYTIRMTSDIDVRLSGLTIKNTGSFSANNDATDPCAFRFTDAAASYICTNCYFATAPAWSMVQALECTGTFIDCVSEDNGYGANGGEASGVFKRCQGGNNSFGGAGSNFSGNALDCEANDDSFGNNGTLRSQAVLTNCVGGNNCFGGGASGDCDGTLTNCRCQAATRCFGGRTIKSNARLFSCLAGANSFGAGGVEPGAELWDCIGTTGCFGGTDAAAGDFHNCVGSHNCFGIVFGGNAWGCTAGDSSFGKSNGMISGGIFQGKAWGCTAGSDSFGKSTFGGEAFQCCGGDGSFGGAGTMSGLAVDCSSGEGGFGHGGAFVGRMVNCRLSKTPYNSGGWHDSDSDWVEAWFPVYFAGSVISTIFSPTGSNKDAVTLPDGATGSFEFCTFRKTGTGTPLGIDVGGAATMNLSYNKFNTAGGWAVGITNNLGVLATSFNIGDTDV